VNSGKYSECCRYAQREVLLTAQCDIIDVDTFFENGFVLSVYKSESSRLCPITIKNH